MLRWFSPWASSAWRPRTPSSRSCRRWRPSAPPQSSARTKTGTLTRNEMTIQRVVTRSGEVAVTGIGYRPEGDLRAGDRPLAEGPLAEEVRAVLGGGSLANDAVLREQDDGQWR